MSAKKEKATFSTAAKMKKMKAEIEAPKPIRTKGTYENTEALVANPALGERSDFLKVNLTLPADLLGALKVYGMKRRTIGQKDTSVSCLLREAAIDLLRNKPI